MLQHLKMFFNIQFKIKECDDDVFASDSESEEGDAAAEEKSQDDDKDSQDDKDKN